MFTVAFTSGRSVLNKLTLSRNVEVCERQWGILIICKAEQNVMEAVLEVLLWKPKSTLHFDTLTGLQQEQQNLQYAAMGRVQSMRYNTQKPVCYNITTQIWNEHLRERWRESEHQRKKN